MKNLGGKVMNMKRLVSLLAICTMVMTLCALPATAATNYMTDGNVGFELGTLDRWNLRTPTEWTFEPASDKASTGTYSMKATATANTTGNHMVSYTGAFTVDLGEEYIFSAMVNIPTTVTEGGIMLRIDYEQGTDKYSGAVMGTNGWQEISVTFTPDTDKFSLSILYRGSTPQGTIIYLDDLQLRKTSEIRADEEAEAARRFMSVSSYTMVSDMEGDDVSKWTPTNATVEVDESSHQGLSSMKMNIATAAADGAAQAKYMGTKPSVTEGEEYEASIWVNIPAGEENISNIRLFMELPKVGESRKYASTYGYITTTNGEWKRLNFKFTPVTGSTGPIVTIRVEVTTTGPATVYWDDLSVVEKEQQVPVLQMLDGGGMDMDALTGGAFTLRYDVHKADAANVGKAFIAAIYKEINGAKLLTELKMGEFTETDKAINLAMDGVTTPDSTYSVRVMLWNSITDLQGLKDKEIKFN